MTWGIDRGIENADANLRIAGDVNGLRAVEAGRMQIDEAFSGAVPQQGVGSACRVVAGSYLSIVTSAVSS